MNRLKLHAVSFGCDPEFFFSKNGVIIGSEKVLPKEGLDMKKTEFPYSNDKVVMDGVQAEIHPSPNTCRANLALGICLCFKAIRKKMSSDKSLELNFSQSTKLTKKEFDTLSDRSKELLNHPVFKLITYTLINHHQFM